MLIMTGEIQAPVPKDGNVRELVQKGVRKVSYVSGVRQEPNMVPRYTVGAPFGQHANIVTPIALEVGDAVDINAEDGKVIAIAGVWFAGGRWRAFADLPGPARKYKIRIIRAAKNFFEELRRDGIKIIYAETDANEPRSLAWLRSLGFELDARSRILYRWSA